MSYRYSYFLNPGGSLVHFYLQVGLADALKFEEVTSERFLPLIDKLLSYFSGLGAEVSMKVDDNPALLVWGLGSELGDPRWRAFVLQGSDIWVSFKFDGWVALLSVLKHNQAVDLEVGELPGSLRAGLVKGLPKLGIEASGFGSMEEYIAAVVAGRRG